MATEVEDFDESLVTCSQCAHTVRMKDDSQSVACIPSLEVKGAGQIVECDHFAQRDPNGNAPP